MSRRETIDQIRRILVLAAEPRPRLEGRHQLSFPLWPLETAPRPDPDLDQLSEDVHALIVELALLIQMEVSGLVASPARKARRRRLGLGALPSLRLLDEWPAARTVEEEPWAVGRPASSREDAFASGLGRIRERAERCGLEQARVTEIASRLYALVSRYSAEDDLPGLIHGHGQRYGLRMVSGRLSFLSDRLRGRSHGVIHTPPALAAELVQILFKAWGKRESEDRPAFLDPACGSGQFLLAAAGRITRGDAEAEPAGLRSLHGVDIDARAARIAAWNLSYWAALRLGAQPDPGQSLDTIFGRAFPYFLGSQIQVGNALQIEPSSFSPGFLWERRFPEVFSRTPAGFDIVAGNPPWVSFGLRDRVSAPDEERRYYERLFPAGTQYKLSLYPIFMELALRLCREGGAHGFLVPDSVLAGHHFSRIRRLLLSSSDLIELTLIEAGLWPGVHVGHTVLYAVRKKQAGLSAPVTVRNRVLGTSGARSRSVQEPVPAGEGEAGAQRASVFHEHAVWVPAVQYTSAGEAPLPIFRNEGEMDFLTRIQSAPLRFRDVAWTYSGLIGRHGQQSIRASEPREEFELRDASGRTVFIDRAARPRWKPSLLSGSEVVEHRVHWEGGHVYWPARSEDTAKIFKSGYDKTRYEQPKVFLRQTGDRLVAACDTRGLFCLNNLHVLGSLEHAGIPPLILCGLLMSGPVQRAYKILSLENARPLAQVDLTMVEALPYPSDSSGAPVGSAPIPSRHVAPARKLIRRLERSFLAEDPAGILEVADRAWRAGPAVAQDPLQGREVIGLLLLWVLEKLQAQAEAAVLIRRKAKPTPTGPRPRTRAGNSASHPGYESYQILLDEIVALFFQVPSSATV